MLSEEESLRLL
jgi:hypothetical protein